jgi:hypothetical protein
MGKRWLKIGLLIVIAAFAFVMLAALGIKRFPPSRFILWPGAAIADTWLHIDIGQPTFALSLFTIDTLIYSVLFVLFFWVLRPFLRRSH